MATERERQAVELEALRRAIEPERDSTIPDERLGLMFACCHPSLAPEASVALTLRLVAGLTVEEIARALLSTPPAISQRLVRAKRTLREARVSVDVPADHELPERLGSVLAVVYLVFNEGHSATGGAQPVRADLCAEAIRLARVLARLMPDESEARGCWRSAWRPTRGARRATTPTAATCRWRITTARSMTPPPPPRRTSSSAARSRKGPAPTRCRRRSRRCTRSRPASRRRTGSRSRRSTRCWSARIHRPSSRSTARSQCHSRGLSGSGLVVARRARGAALDYSSFHAALADVQRRRGDVTAARAAYVRALELTDNPGEREFLARRVNQLGE